MLKPTCHKTIADFHALSRNGRKRFHETGHARNARAAHGQSGVTHQKEKPGSRNLFSPHWCRNIIVVRYRSTDLNHADLLTKPLGPEPFRRFRDAVLNAKVVLPDAQPVTANYVSRLAQYLLHAISLPD